MKHLNILLSFLVGLLIGAGILVGYWHWQHSTTEVWVAQHPLKSDDGILIPEGTELVFKQWMPEGFAALELGINIEGEALNNFQHRTEQESFLRIPYFLDSNDND